MRKCDCFGWVETFENKSTFKNVTINFVYCPFCGKHLTTKDGDIGGHCMCNACKDGVLHTSDCSVHNEPAMPNGQCNCGALKHSGIEDLEHWLAYHSAVIAPDDKRELLSIISKIIKEAGDTSIFKEKI